MPRIVMEKGENEFIGGNDFHKRVKLALDRMRPDETIVIDLDNLYLDSSLVGTLLAIYTSCRRRNISMALENASPQTRNILDLSGLLKILCLE